MVLYGVVCLSKIHYFCFSSGILNWEEKRMGRPKRLYPLGKYRLRTPKEPESDKAYPVELEYTWNRQIIRKTTNVFVKAADWNQNGNHGRGEVRASYGSEYKRVNQLLLARVDRIDALLA